MSLAILFHFLCAQHVSDINICIISGLRLFCWTTALVVLFLVRCVLEIRCGWVGVVTVLHTDPPWIYNFVVKGNRTWDKHKYKNIHNFGSVKYYKHFIQTVLCIIFTNKNIFYRTSGVCFWVFSWDYFKFCLFIILKDWRTVWETVENCNAAYNILFWKQEIVVFGLWRWYSLYWYFAYTSIFWKF